MFCRFPVYDTWMLLASAASEYRLSTSTKFMYQSTGSSDGKQRLVDGSVHFAGSDSALSSSDTQQMPNVWFVPSLAGAIAIGFNVPSMADLQLRIPRQTLADIYLGKIRRWSELAQWNPMLASVDQNISLVVRSDSSGTTEAFTGALSRFSDEWASAVGASSNPTWPRRDFAGEGNNGVALQIRLNPYSLGYVSYADAIAFQVTMARVSNAVGTFVAPTLQSVQSAVDAFASEFDEMTRSGSQIFFQSISDPKDAKDAYPIATLTYLAFDAARLSCEILQPMLSLLYWAWSDPQAKAIAERLSFVVMTERARGFLVNALRKIVCLEARPGVKALNRLKPFDQVMFDSDPSILGAGASLP
jgi:phosphate transport system substrate-binding protein